MPKPAKTKKSKPKKAKPSFKPYFIHYFYCLAVIALLLLTSLNINKFLINQKVLGASVDNTPLLDEKAYWQKIVSDNPSYVDGYLQLAKIEVELGNKIEAQTFINKALSLDPNSSKIPKVISALNL